MHGEAPLEKTDGLNFLSLFYIVSLCHSQAFVYLAFWHTTWWYWRKLRCGNILLRASLSSDIRIAAFSKWSANSPHPIRSLDTIWSATVPLQKLDKISFVFVSVLFEILLNLHGQHEKSKFSFFLPWPLFFLHELRSVIVTVIWVCENTLSPNVWTHTYTTTLSFL